MPEGGNLGAPDRSKAKFFGQQRVLDGSRSGRQTEVISQHDMLQKSVSKESITMGGVVKSPRVE